MIKLTIRKVLKQNNETGYEINGEEVLETKKIFLFFSKNLVKCCKVCTPPKSNFI